MGTVNEIRVDDVWTSVVVVVTSVVIVVTSVDTVVTVKLKKERVFPNPDENVVGAVGETVEVIIVEGVTTQFIAS